MKYMVFISLLLALVLVGCDNGPEISTIEWELSDDGFIRWYTNDLYYCNTHSWNLYTNTNSNAPDTYEIECKKISGSHYLAYGMIFGASDSVDNQYYYVNINVDGKFCVNKNINGTHTQLKEFTESNSLNKGYNTINSIKVTKLGDNYTIYLNDTEVHDFTDTSITGTRIGYIVFVGTEATESFPKTSVDVRFKQK